MRPGAIQNASCQLNSPIWHVAMFPVEPPISCELGPSHLIWESIQIALINPRVFSNIVPAL